MFLKIACDWFILMMSFTEPGDITYTSKFSYQHFNNQILVGRHLDKDLHDCIFMLELILPNRQRYLLASKNTQIVDMTCLSHVYCRVWIGLKWTEITTRGPEEETIQQSWRNGERWLKINTRRGKNNLKKQSKNRG